MKRWVDGWERDTYLAPPGMKPSALASYSPVIKPMNSDMQLR